MTTLEIVQMINEETWVLAGIVFMACMFSQAFFSYMRYKHQKVICPIDVVLSRLDSHGCAECAKSSDRCSCPSPKED